jgi:hypothetical protein
VIQQDDHVLAVLDQATALRQHHVRHLHVTLRRFVEGRADDLALDRPRHVGDLFGALVDEQHDEVYLGMVLRDGIGDLLQDHGLAGTRRRDDQAALPLPDGCQEVDQAGGQIGTLVLEVDQLVGIERGEVVEERDLLGLLRILVVDRLDLEQGEVPLVVLRRPDLAGHGVAGLQVELLDLGR